MKRYICASCYFDEMWVMREAGMLGKASVAWQSRDQSILRTVALAFCVYALLTVPAHAKQPLKAGDMPPDDLGRVVSGDKVHLGDYHGKIVIISFWASWCGPCRKELPVLAAIQADATRDKIVVFAVNWKEDYDRYRTIVKALKNVDLNLVSDERGRLGSEYGVSGIPHMIIIGRDGRIAAVHVGYGEGELPILVKEINGLWLQTE